MSVCLVQNFDFAAKLPTTATMTAAIGNSSCSSTKSQHSRDHPPTSHGVCEAKVQISRPIHSGFSLGQLRQHQQARLQGFGPGLLQVRQGQRLWMALATEDDEFGVARGMLKRDESQVAEVFHMYILKSKHVGPGRSGLLDFVWLPCRL